MGYEDKTLECVECGANFTFTASEQEFFASKGYTNEPKRCFECRQRHSRALSVTSTSRDSAGLQRSASPIRSRPAPFPRRSKRRKVRAGA